MKNLNFIAKDRWEELHQFFGAYFHQDWTLEADSPDEVVRIFINDGFCRSELMNLATDVETYADSKLNDAAAEEGLMSELGCYYLPSADNTGAKAWLCHVATLLRSA